MARYTTTISSTKSAEDAFDYLADFASVSEWDPSCVRAERLTAAAGPGARFDVVVKVAGRETELSYETRDYDRPKRVVHFAETSTYSSEDTITVTPSEGGCTVTYDANLRLKGLFKVGDPLLALVLRRLGDDAAAGLRRELGA